LTSPKRVGVLLERFAAAGFVVEREARAVRVRLSP